jgi:uncharacterized lipoprotein YajG
MKKLLAISIVALLSFTACSTSSEISQIPTPADVKVNNVNNVKSYTVFVNVDEACDEQTNLIIGTGWEMVSEKLPDKSANRFTAKIFRTFTNETSTLELQCASQGGPFVTDAGPETLIRLTPASDASV